MRFKRLLFLLFTILFVSANAGNGFSIKTVVIDAGHGGKDPGASGPGKTNEKDVALAVALKLGAEIQKTFPDVNVIYTRKTDVFIELHERAEIANKSKADLFIAIHCNSSTSPTVYGTSTYVLGLHRTEANLEVAKRENSVILLENDRDKNYEFDPNSSEGNIIMSLRQNAFLDQSIDIASKIEAQYETGAKRKSLGVKQAGFYVIYKTAMPSLLSEIGFISNPNEEKFLNSEKGQEQIASSILKAFKDYKFEMENSEGEQFAYQEAQRKAEAADTIASKPAKLKTEVSSHAPIVKPVASTPETEKPAEEKQSTPSIHEDTKATTQPTDAESLSVTLLSGRKIKKPLDNASGGGVAPDANPKASETPPVKNDVRPVATKTETKKQEPAPVKSEAPKIVEKKDSAPIEEPVADKPAPITSEPKSTLVIKEEVPQPAKKVSAGNSGGATIAKESNEEGRSPTIAAQPKPVKSEAKTEAKAPVVVKSEEKPTAVKIVKKAPEEETAIKPVKKNSNVETTTKAVVKPAKGDQSGKMTFKVQLIALKGPMKASEVTKVTKVLGEITNEPIPSGLIRYYAGYSKTYLEAKRKIAVAVEAGYKDAFIVGFKDGVRFGPEKLKAYENQ